jgi:hypothetical protein
MGAAAQPQRPPSAGALSTLARTETDTTAGRPLLLAVTCPRQRPAPHKPTSARHFLLYSQTQTPSSTHRVPGVFRVHRVFGVHRGYRLGSKLCVLCGLCGTGRPALRTGPRRARILVRTLLPARRPARTSRGLFCDALSPLKRMRSADRVQRGPLCPRRLLGCLVETCQVLFVVENSARRANARQLSLSTPPVQQSRAYPQKFCGFMPRQKTTFTHCLVHSRRQTRAPAGWRDSAFCQVGFVAASRRKTPCAVYYTRVCLSVQIFRPDSH